MLSIILSMAVAALFGGGLYLTTSLHPSVSVIAGMVVFTLIYVLLLKRIMNSINVAMDGVQKDLMANRPEVAVRKLEEVQKKFGPWQLFVKKQMNAQIGMVYYMRRDFNKAFEYLNQGFARHWIAMAMLAIIHMKRNQPKQMIATFDKALVVTRKEPLLWSLYAFCLDKIGDRNKAASIMEKGLKKVGSDELMSANLAALKAGGKMKMQGYGDLWHQFQLEKQGDLIRKHTKAIQGRRKIVRR